MAVDWGAAYTHWEDFAHPDGTIRKLSHLHPMNFVVTLPESMSSERVDIRVTTGFALHTFTRTGRAGDDPTLVYGSYREDRVFDDQRYTMSTSLPDIVRSLGLNRSNA